MPRKSKGIHTSPETAGSHNLTESYKAKISLKEGEENVMTKIAPLWKIAMERRDYKGQWDEEKFKSSIFEFFTYFEENNLKPSVAGLAIFLNANKQQVYDWKNFPSKYGYKSDMVNQAILIIEEQYIERSEKYPTANTFLLRTSHGHIETSKLDVTTNGNDITSAEEVKDLVSKLGLDK